MSNDKDIDQFADTDDVTDESFYEDDGSFGDDDLSGEDWESFDDDAEDGFDQPPAKKKNSNFNKIVIAGAVVVGLIVMYMQVSGDGKKQAQQMQQMQMQQQMAQTAQQPQQQMPQAAAPSQGDIIFGTPQRGTAPDAQQQQQTQQQAGGFLNDPNAINQLVREQDDALYYDTPAPRGPQEMQDQPPMPAPISTEGDGQVLTPLPETAGTPATFAANATSPDVSDALEEKLGQILDRLDDIETQVTALQETAVRKEEMEALRQSLAGLQKEAKKKADKPAATTAKASTPPKQSASPAASSGQRDAVLTSWILKSAQPGRALIARQGSGETFSIAVGDSLSGIGRITSIAPENGRWVVQGTQGKILQ